MLGESCFKVPKALLDEYFYHWNVYFFELKIDFKSSQFWSVGVASTEFHLFKLSLLPVLGKTCFKAPKVTLNECIYH